MKIKAIVAGILATLSLGANAASTISATTIVAPNNTTGSDLVLEVFDSTNGQTYFGNLGVLAGQFNASTSQSWNLGADANWNAFYKAGDSYVFNVTGGISNQAKVNTFTSYGDYITAGTVAPTFFSGAAFGLTPIDAAWQQMNSNDPTLNGVGTGSGVIAANTAGASWDAISWNTLSNSTYGVDTSAGANVGNLFYHLGLNSNKTFNETLLGSFTLNTAGKSLDFASASTPPATVPVPGAIWLVGSALLGLVRFGFRGNKA